MQDAERLAKKADKTSLVNALIESGAVADPRKGKDFFKCCFHNENSGSLHVYEGEGGWLAKCHGCGWAGDIFDVIAKCTNKTPGEVLAGDKPARPAAPPPVVYATLEKLTEAVKYQNAAWKLTQTNTYTNPATGNHDLVTLRLEQGEEKTFRQAHQTPNGYVMRAGPDPQPLFNRGRIKDATECWIVEGEKCVRAITAAGAVATTSPGGAGKASHADWQPVAGKRLYVWPDNDPVNEKTHKSGGIDHGREIVAICQKLNPPCEIFWIDPRKLELGEKEDAADYLAPGKTPEEKKALLDDAREIAEPVGLTQGLLKRIDAIADGSMAAIEWPWFMLSKQTRALRPGTITVICGSPGASKSFFLLEAMLFWLQKGIKCAWYILEDDLESQLHRALAQLTNRAEITDDDWLRDNRDEARRLAIEWQPLLEQLARVTTQSEAMPTLDDVLNWIRAQAESGQRIIAVDPVTAAEPTGDEWKSDRRFVVGCKPILRKTGASLILVSHPRKGAKEGHASMDDIAGGTAYQRFSQTVLWYQYLQTVEAATYGRAINRKLKILKARNGKADVREIGMWFDPTNLRQREIE